MWPVALDRLGSVVSPTYGGSQDPYPGGGPFCRQRAGGEVMGRVEPGQIDERQAVHGWLGCGDVEVLDHENQLCRLRWRQAPAQIGGQVSSANPLTGMLSWDRLSFPEGFACHDEQLWSLQVRTVPRRIDVSAFAVLQEHAEERHFVLPSMSRISAVVVVAPSLGKMRSTLFAWASESTSVIASI